ncbi:MAG: hypothetical protein KC496_10795 [Anaerolineae bacterium]|nr:hypothetical protein [Anaerolineae bacterium]
MHLEPDNIFTALDDNMTIMFHTIIQLSESPGGVGYLDGTMEHIATKNG